MLARGTRIWLGVPPRAPAASWLRARPHRAQLQQSEILSFPLFVRLQHWTLSENILKPIFTSLLLIAPSDLSSASDSFYLMIMALNQILLLTYLLRCLLLQMSHVVWSAWLSVGRTVEPCKNGWTDRTFVGQRNQVLDAARNIFTGRNIFGGCPTDWNALRVSNAVCSPQWRLLCSWLVDVTLHCPRGKSAPSDAAFCHWLLVVIFGWKGGPGQTHNSSQILRVICSPLW